LPRRPPDSVIETRHALGVWERKQVETITTAASLGAVGIGVGVAAVGIGAGLAGFALYQWLKDGPFSDIFSPEWRDANLPVWSEEQRAIYREQNPTLWSQMFDGPGILWSMITDTAPRN
jgi:hypothetical protein